MGPLSHKFRRLAKDGDLWLVVALFGTVLLLILPVAPFILDGLLATSIALSLLTLLVILYLQQPADFTGFPTLPEQPAFAQDSHPTQQDLWQRYHHDADPGAENELVRQYLPLVKTVVGRLAMSLPPHVDLADLEGAALVGLPQAMRHFNPHTGVPFESYARLRIRGAALDELRLMDWVPRSVRERAPKIQDTLGRLDPMTTLPPEPFVPFVSTDSFTQPDVQAIATTSLQGDQAELSLPASNASPVASLLPDLSKTAVQTEPRLTLHRENGRITRITVQGQCGQTIEIGCLC